MSCNFRVTFGSAEKENYQVYRLKLPVRYYNYCGLLSLGYIDQGEKIDMHFSNPLRGYDFDEKQGVILVLLSLERNFSFFPCSRKPFLGALQWRIFADVGTVYNNKTDFALQNSVGAGLLYNTPLFDICLDLAFTEKGIKPVFEIAGKVF